MNLANFEFWSPRPGYLRRVTNLNAFSIKGAGLAVNDWLKDVAPTNI